MQRRIRQAQKYLEWDQPNQAIAELRPALNSEKMDQQYRWLPNHMMGIAFSLKGDHKGAASYLEKSIKYGSDQPETYHMLSVNYYNLGRFEEAEKYGNEAVQRQDDFLKAWLNLGAVYRSQAKLDQALRCYKKANELDPSNASVAFRIGEIYRDQGDLDQALKLFEITLKIDDSYNSAMLELADIYKKKGNFAEAQRCLLETKEKHGDTVASKVGLAELYKEQGDYDRAIAMYEELLEDQPQNGALRINYALCLQELSRFDESDKHYRRAIEDMPGRQEPISNYLMGLHYNPRNTKEFIFDEHRRLVSNFTESPKEGRPIPQNISADKKLKVGFVSGGFRRHPVGFMIAGGLEQLPDDQFEIYCYTTNNKYDFITRRIHKNIDVWRSVVGYSTKVLSKIIRDDEIDILVDLSGHAENTRLQVMAQEPSPVIVKWVGGLFNTTGMECFDYLISDSYESPDGEEPFYTEKLVRMPDDYISYTPPAYAPDIGGLPVKENGYITLGCFNNPTKINEQILGRWAEIMKAIPGSHLYLKSKQYDTASFRDQILRFMDGEGIANERIEFEGHTSHDDHLECYNKVDIALDPWPYSGGLTTCEALYMGVPVITLPGPTFAGRHSTTHLMNAGLEQWVTDSWDEYSEKTVALAKDQEALEGWRNKLRKQLLGSPVCDGKRFGAHLAVAFREMWKQRVAGYEADTTDWQDHITVDTLSADKIKHLTDGPDTTPFITIKDKDNAQSINAIDKKDMPQNAVEESMIDTRKIAQDYLDDNSRNGVGHSQKATNNPIKDYQVEIAGDVSVCVPDDLDVLTTYVLKEQGQWFEPEVDFLREYVQPGMKVVDVGACFGSYALPLAQKVGPKGRVFAFEPSADSRTYLEKSKIVNGLNHLEIYSCGISDEYGSTSMSHAQSPEFHTVNQDGVEAINLTKFDAWWCYAGQPAVDVIKIDVNGMEAMVLAGAAWLLEGSQPILVVTIGEQEKDFIEVKEQLNDHGYRLYEYIPGPGLLAEHDPEAGVDSSLMNVIAVPESKIAELEETGWIFDNSVEIESPDPNSWKEVLGNQPWAASLISDWDDNISTGNNKLYLQALNLACAAEKVKVSTDDPASRSQKGAMMLAAAQKLTELFNTGNAGIPAALTYVRIMSQLGKKVQAVEMAKQLMETVNAGKGVSANLPFLPPLPEQDSTAVETEFSNWLTVRMVEAWVTLQHPTTYMAEEQEKKMMKALEGNPEREKKFQKCVDLMLDMQSANTNGVGTVTSQSNPDTPLFLHLCFNNMHVQSFVKVLQELNDSSRQKHVAFVEKRRSVSHFTVDLNDYDDAHLFDHRKIEKLIAVSEAAQPAAIIVHGLFFPWQKRFIKEVNTKAPIYWSVWGGDLYNPIRQERPFYDVFGKLDGVISKVDKDYELLTETYGKIHRVNSFSYGVRKGSEDITTQDNRVEPKRIIVGNSGDPSNKHAEIIRTLAGKEDIKDYQLYIPFAYNGSPQYLAKLKELISLSGLENNTTFQTEFKPPSEYDKILKESSYLVCAHERQQALGTIKSALYFGNIVFVRHKLTDSQISPNWQHLDEEQLPAMAWEDLIKADRISDFPFPDEETLTQIRENLKYKFDIEASTQKVFDALQEILAHKKKGRL